MSATPDRPLDPHTLRVVIDRLKARVAQVTATVEGDEGDYDDRDARLWELKVAIHWISGFLAFTSDRARVVVLPEPFTDRADVKHWHLPFGTIISTARGVVAFKGSRLDEMTNDEAADAGAALIAAAVAEFAGGAK